MTATATRAGRPRSHAADEAILTAALDVVREQGYGALVDMRIVAMEVTVAKATIHLARRQRRVQSKVQTADRPSFALTSFHQRGEVEQASA